MAANARSPFSFRWNMSQARIAQDLRLWLQAYHWYRAALDCFPRSAACYVQMGHCLKELDRYEAAECAYRSALLLGAPLGDVAEHLLFVADHCDWPETMESIRALGDAAGRGDGEAGDLPTLDEILSSGAAQGIAGCVPATRCVRWMRERISRSELDAQHLADMAAAAAGVDIRCDFGFPPRQSPKLGALWVVRWLSLKWLRWFSSQPDVATARHVVRWSERLDDLGLLPEDVAHNVSLKQHVAPKLSVVIVNFNKAQLTLKSVKSVLASSISVPFEIVVVDNGSEVREHEILKAAATSFRLLRLERNAFFGEGSNLGAEAALGEYVLFLNNDAFLLPGTVEELLEAFAENSDCGATGPVFYYPDGRLQEAGAFVNSYGASRQRGKGDPWFRVEALPRFDVVDYVSGACLMIRRQDFRQFGGFDPIFAPAYYEDTDLCLKLRGVSLKVYLASDARCIHIEGASSTLLPDPGARRARTSAQRRAFVGRWGRALRGRVPTPLPLG